MDNEVAAGALGGVDVYVMNADGSGVQPLLDDEAVFGDDLHELYVAEWRDL